jgi:hypothetical protein
MQVSTLCGTHSVAAPPLEGALVVGDGDGAGAGVGAGVGALVVVTGNGVVVVGAGVVARVVVVIVIVVVFVVVAAVVVDEVGAGVDVGATVLEGTGAMCMAMHRPTTLYGSLLSTTWPKMHLVCVS